MQSNRFEVEIKEVEFKSIARLRVSGVVRRGPNAEWSEEKPRTRLLQHSESRTRLTKRTTRSESQIQIIRRRK